MLLQFKLPNEIKSSIKGNVVSENGNIKTSSVFRGDRLDTRVTIKRNFKKYNCQNQILSSFDVGFICH